MSRTTTKIVDLQRVELRGDSGLAVMKLMMACNDMQLVNEALSGWKEAQPRHRQHRAAGAGMYFVRLQMAHLYEALDVLDEIRKDESLRQVIERCDAQTRESFGKLEPFLPGGSRRDWVQKKIGTIRNSLVFHYDQSGKLVKRAIVERANNKLGRYSSVTRGSTAYLWHFKPADDIVDNIVVRKIWDIQETEATNLRIEVDRTLDEIHQLFLYVTDFSEEFIWKWLD